nr:hypothetical protein GCM10020093_000460 [Planobispora longispora]
MKLKLDLHPIYNRGGEIDKALRGIIDEAIRKRATEVEIIPGKGSGQLKKKVLRFLEQKEIKALYHRIDKDAKNHGRLFVYFRCDPACGNSRRPRCGTVTVSGSAAVPVAVRAGSRAAGQNLRVRVCGSELMGRSSPVRACGSAGPLRPPRGRPPASRPRSP